jgi:predicted CXXCH cytochrome family protein
MMRTQDALGRTTRRYGPALLSVAVGLFVAAFALAYTGTYTPGVGINGTVHDLGTVHNGMNYVANPADPQHRICVFCHAPHNTYRLATAPGGAGPQAPPEFDYLPLWNHTLQTNLVYQPYENGPGAPQSGPKASQAILTGMTIGSNSLLCLSCHDGSVAVNSWGNANQVTMSTGTTTIAPGYVIGQDHYLGNHHPIGFDFDVVQAGDTEIRSADVAFLTPTTSVRDHLYGSNHMECGTCHSVHNKGNTGERLLWRSDQNSELCLTCHDKGIYTAP